MSRRPTDLSIMAVDLAEGLQVQEAARTRANGPTRSVKRWTFKKGFRVMPKAWAQALDDLPPEYHAVAHCLLRRRWRYVKEPRLPVGNKAFERVGITRRTKMRALLALEKAGLVTVEPRGERKSPYVTLHKLE
jgi:hypothetical protein